MAATIAETGLNELPEETIEKNLEFLVKIRGSSQLPESAIIGKKWFPEEVRNLFYFFDGVYQSAKREKS